MSQLHISVIGAGNMGCLYGANLARAGHRVTFIDPWAEHVEAIRSRGLRMEGLHGSFVVSAEASMTGAGVSGVDVAIDSA
jgi:2-dehydropantoate 2-reductase